MRKIILIFLMCFIVSVVYSQRIATGQGWNVAIKSDGSLLNWGDYIYNLDVLPSGNNYSYVEAGTYHCLALKTDGSLVGWGWNDDGQCNVPAGNNYIAISGGSRHSMALKSDGSIICWGGNAYGQCNSPSGNNFIAISSGANFCTALRSDGSIVCWGQNDVSQCNAPAGNNFIAISGGPWHSLALKSDGSLSAWGHNLAGECNVPTGNNFVAISAGNSHSHAIKSDGSVTSWGNNSSGECNSPTGNNFIRITSGSYHSTALKSDGSFISWPQEAQFEPPEPNSGYQVFPSIVITASDNITSNSATFMASVQPYNYNISVSFEYGTTTGYGTSISVSQPVIKYLEKIYSSDISGLIPNQLYHFRIVVDTGAAAKIYGIDQTFTTSQIAPTVTTNAATGVGSTGATMNGTVNANNLSTTVTFEYGTTTGYGTTATAAESPASGTGNTSVSKSITGLVPNTTYHYRVIGVNSAGTTNGSDQIFTTSAASATVTTNGAGSITGTGATLNGTINANNSSTTATFEYGTTTGYGTTVTAVESPAGGTNNTSVSKAITGLLPNTTYHYRAVGVNAGGTTNGSDTTFTTSQISPTVTTNAASVIGTTGATLNGTVNANNLSTTVTFEYGTTTGYGTTVTAAESPASGTSNTSVSKSITGLVPNTTYHYRVIGVNSAGTTNGSDQTFTTSTAVPTATTNAASSVGTTGATLNGTVNANNASTTVTFEYGTTTGYGTTVTAVESPASGTSNTSVSKSITGLVPNTTYHYRVIGVNGAGTTNGSDQIFTTSAAVPTATTNAASSVGTTGATLNGTVNANNASTTVTFEYGTTTGYGTTVTAVESPASGTSNTSVSKSITGLVPNTTYHYRVIGVNGAGTTNGSDQIFTTSAAVPTATTNAASSVGTTGATLNGTVNANNASTTVTFEYGTTTGYGTTVTAVESPASGTSNTSVSKSITGLVPNTTYHYRVIGVNGAGTTNGSDQTFTTSAAVPTATTNAASSVGTTGATLNGTVNANNAGTTVTFEYGTTTGYGTTVTAVESPASGTGNTSVSKSITGLVPNTTYHYRVIGVNGAGTTNGSDQIFTTSAAVPTATTNAASSVGTTGATLNGTVNANNASTTVMFEYGTTTGYGTTVTAAESPASGTSNTSVSKSITGLVPNTTYHYRVIGVNGAGTTNGLDQIFTTSAASATVTTNGAGSITGTGATLNGTINANNSSTTATFEYGTTTGYGTTVTAVESPAGGTNNTSVSKAITGLLPNTTYHYRAVGVNAGGTTNGSDTTFTTSQISPTVTTNAASGIGTSGASLNGTVNANNLSTTVTFEYGTTTGYGTTVTAVESPASGTGNTSVSKSITGLVPNTTYHYRVIGVNGAGTTNGSDQTFTTTAIVPTATTNAASSVGTTGATLNGTVNANNASTTVTFEYGTTTGYGTTVTAVESPASGTSNTSVSKSITGLVPNTTYHYRVIGVNGAGTTNGSDQIFTTSAAVPTATTNAASSVGTTGATLNGTVNANNASTTVTFEYGTTTGYGTTVTAVESPASGTSNTSVSKSITGLVPNTTYHYRVIGVNGAGTTNGSDQTFTTSTAVPTATTNAASSVGTTGATLNGTVNANNASTTVTFEYGTTTGYGTTVTAAESPASGTGNTSVSKSITGLVPNTTYHYRVIGVNGAGTTNGSDQTFTTTAIVPTATTNAASSVGTTGATLNGTVNANNASTTVTFEYGTTTGYGTTATAAESPASGTGNTSVSKSITGLVPNTTYHYRVIGVNSAGTTNGSDQIFTTSAAVPTATTNAASSVGTTGATLNGTVNANNASTTVMFEYGTTTGYGTTVTAAESPASGTSNTSVSKSITGLVPNTTYHYRVIGVNGAGTTNGLDQIFTTSTAVPTATTNAASSVGTTGATLNGTVNANNAGTTVTFEYGTTTGYGTTVTAVESPASGTSNTSVSKSITGLVPNTTYHYRVIGVNGAGTTNGSDQTFTTSAAVPTATTNAASSVGTTGATLNGTVNANNAGTTVTFEYGTTTGYGTTVTAVESPASGTGNTSVSKSITGLVPNTTYHYRVIGVNGAGTTNGSDQTFTTTAIVPTATTNAASSVGTTGATLNGTVNANNLSTTVTFEYGTTTGYGTTVTAAESPASGTGNTSVSKSITGLVPNTTYHYRVIGVNGAGTTNGSDQTFTTSAASATVTTNGAGSITGTGATLNGTVNANNASTTVTFEYGTTTGYGTTVTAVESPAGGTNNTSVSKAITGLLPNTTYHYRAVGVNAGGTTNGSDITFTTSQISPTVTTNAASVIGTTGATLNGTVNANNASTTVTFEYGTTTGYGTTVTAVESPASGTGNTSVSKSITGLVPNTTYHYRVIGVNGAGTTNGSDQTFTTTAIVPTATTNAASSVGTTGATLNGTVNANNASTTVTFEYGTTTGYGTTATAAESPASGTGNTSVSKSITGLVPNTTYHYRVIGVNSAGTTNGSDQIFTTSAASATVTTNGAGGITGTGATLNGTINANNSSTTATFEYGTTTGYGTTVTAVESPAGGTNNTSVSKAITGLLPNTTYHYRAVGVNAGGTTNGSDTTFTTSQISPTVTTNAVSVIGTTGATLNGTVNANNLSTTVTFEYGTTTGYGTTVTAVESPASGTSNTSVSKSITGLVPNTTYHYRVIGVNGAGTTNGSDQTFTTSAAVPTATTNAASSVGTTGATLNGTVNANNAGTTVTFEYGTTTGYGTTVTAAESPASGTGNTSVSKSITGLVPNTTYHYRVIGVNSAGTTNGSDQTFTTSAASATVTANGAGGITGTGATLNGTINANNSSTTATFEYGTTTGYGTTVTAVESPAGGTNNTSVSKAITGLLPNTTYHYRAVGVNAGGTTNGSDTTFTTSQISPTVTTNAASVIGTTGATLNGTVNANNLSTTVTFEYGTTTGYGTTVTAVESPASGTSNTSVSKSITGLVPNTTYHYRVIGVNGAGTTNGSDQTFTTSAAVPTATTNAASSVGTTGATLNGTVNPNNSGTTVSFEYGKTISYGHTISSDSGTINDNHNIIISKGISNLEPNMLYHYRVVGVNSVGTTYGADITFTTQEAQPDVNTNTATIISDNQATLNGSITAKNRTISAKFEYGFTSNYGTIVVSDQIQVTGNTSTPINKTITGLLPNTTYHFRAIGSLPVILKLNRMSVDSNNILSPNSDVYGDDQTFTTLPVNIISGVITNNSTPHSGVTVSCTGKPDIVSGADGRYSFTVLRGGNYTITPSLILNSFTPLNAVFNNISENKEQNFISEGQSTFSASPVNLDFGTVGQLTDEPEKTILVSNTSSAASLVISSVYFSSSQPAFRIISSPNIIAPNDTGKIIISMTTGTPGTYTDQLNIINNSVNVRQSIINIQGTVAEPGFTVPETQISTAYTDIDRSKDTISFKIINGRGSFKKSTMSVIRILTKTIEGDTNSFHFIKNNENVILSPGEVDETLIEFYPQTLGNKAAKLIITTSDILSDKINIVLNGVCNGSPKISAISGIDFGEVRYRNTIDTIIILKNEGNLPLNIRDIQIKNNDFDDFCLLTANSRKELKSREIDTIKIRYNNKLPVGKKTAQIRIMSNDTSQNPYSINLTGFLKTSLISLSADRISFNTKNMGEYQDTIIKIKNTGNDILIINRIYIDGLGSDNFSFEGIPVSLQPGCEQSVKIRFEPMSEGEHISRIAIMSNDPLFSEHAIILVGKGRPAIPLPVPRIVPLTNNGLNQPTDIKLTWSRVDKVKHYTIHIDKIKNNMAAIVLYDSLIIDTFKVVKGLCSNSEYQFKISARNSYTSSPWSQFYKFTTLNNPPSSFSLVSPGRDGVVQLVYPVKPLLFKWNRSVECDENDLVCYSINISGNSYCHSISNLKDTICSIDIMLTLLPKKEYNWYVSATDGKDTTKSEVFKFGTSEKITELKESESAVENFELLQNYPNPFNPTTIIKYKLPVNSFVILKIYDVTGREVATMIEENQPAGTHELNWNASGLPSGIYYYKIHTENFVSMKKLILLK